MAKAMNNKHQELYNFAGGVVLYKYCKSNAAH